jgi:aspartyl protease family protein
MSNSSLVRFLVASFATLASLFASLSQAADVKVVGLFPGKALVSINGGAPKSLSTGQRSPEGVLLVSTSSDSATFEISGKRSTLKLGQAFGPAQAAAADYVLLTADTRGHFMTVGAINGKAARLMIDTGATSMWLSGSLAQQMGISYLNAPTTNVSTAGGTRVAHRVMLDSVRVGGLTLNQVEALIGDGAGTGELVLVGMSFLDRLSMEREGNTLKLSRKEGARTAATDSRPSIKLKDDGRGAFFTDALVNGVNLNFIVDTGATSVSIDTALAQRLGINYQLGQPMMSHTANGVVRSWRVKFDTVTLGPITIYGVEGTVRDAPSPGFGLLGMSFLNRVEMRRDKDTMTLTKRF